MNAFFLRLSVLSDCIALSLILFFSFDFLPSLSISFLAFFGLPSVFLVVFVLRDN